MLQAYAVTDAAGKSLFAFKLHQFIAGGGKVYTTLEAPGKRAITLDGQQFVSGDDERQRRYYHVHFCRDCGQEYIPVWDTDGRRAAFNVRSIEERQHDDEQVKFGFLMPDGEAFGTRNPWSAIQSHGSRSAPTANGASSPPSASSSPRRSGAPGWRVQHRQGLPAWFIPGLSASAWLAGVATTSGKDALRLTSLSGEGRSSATTMLTLSALRYLYEQDQQLVRGRQEGPWLFRQPARRRVAGRALQRLPAGAADAGRAAVGGAQGGR